MRKFLDHRLLHENTADSGAALAAVAKATFAGEMRREIEVGILQHDERRMPAKLKARLLVARGGGNLPAHGGAAGEGHQLHTFVADQGARDFIESAMDAAQHSAGQSRL